MRLSLTRHRGCAGKKIPWLDRRTAALLERTALSLEGPAGGVDFVVADDAFVRELNRRYRNVDRPTDVLSFSYVEDPAPRAKTGAVTGRSGKRGKHAPGDEAAGRRKAGERGTAGEVYVSYETVERNARAEGVPPEHLFLRVGVHGLLHVLGYDHEKRAQAARMESEEKRLLLEHLTPSEVEELF